MNAKVTAEMQEALRRWMEKHGANKSDVARALGVTEPGVARWLRASAIGTKIQSHNVVSMRHLGILPAEIAPARALTYPEGSSLPAREFRDAQADPLFRRLAGCWPKMTAEQQNSVARWCAEILERDQTQATVTGSGVSGLQGKEAMQPEEKEKMPNAPPTSATVPAPKPAPPARGGARARHTPGTPPLGGDLPRR